jgi:hypothetical protein
MPDASRDLDQIPGGGTDGNAAIADKRRQFGFAEIIPPKTPVPITFWLAASLYFHKLYYHCLSLAAISNASSLPNYRGRLATKEFGDHPIDKHAPSPMVEPDTPLHS